jgi:hypothetical protein
MKKFFCLFLWMAFFSGCTDNIGPGGQSYPLGLETHRLLLKNDGTPGEVRVKEGGWMIAGVVSEGEWYENSRYVKRDDKGNTATVYRDTMIFDWIEIYRILDRPFAFTEGHTLKVKPLPNTAGSERSIEIVFFAPYFHDCDLVITQSN